MRGNVPQQWAATAAAAQEGEFKITNTALCYGIDMDEVGASSQTLLNVYGLTLVHVYGLR